MIFFQLATSLNASVKHRIDLNNEVLFKQRHRFIPSLVYEEVCTHLQQVLDAGEIHIHHKALTFF